LGFGTIVEGVELVDDLTFVMKEGAAVAQGYYFSEALPIGAFETFVNARRLRQLSTLGQRHSRQPEPYSDTKRLAR